MSAPKPHVPFPVPETVPLELQPLRQWVGFRFELDDEKDKWKKVPCSALTGERVAWPTSGVPFADAVTGASRLGLDGVGIYFLGNGPYVGIDLDSCVTDGTLDPSVKLLVEMLSAKGYVELSPSRTGLHAIVRARVGRNIEPTPIPGSGVRVEVKQDRKYLTFTGCRWAVSQPVLLDAQAEIDQLLRWLKEPAPRASMPADDSRPMSVDSARRIYASHLEKLRTAPAGTRNETLNKVCFFAARAFAAKALDKDEKAITEEIRFIAEQAGLSPDEIRATANSGWNKGVRQPLVIKTESTSELTTVSADTIQPERVGWIWEDKIPRRALTIFAGNPDVGKTTAALDLIARVTTAREMPGASDWLVAGSALVLSAEDDPAVDLVPRLTAAGANLKKVHFVKGIEIRNGATRAERMVALDTDVKQLIAALKKISGVVLIVIDPISAYFGRKKINSTQEAREVLSPLAALCRDCGVSIVAIEHFTKRSDVGAIHKTGGAVALIGAARAAFMFAKDPEQEGRYVMHFLKGNRSKRKVGISYRIDERQVADVGGVASITWGDHVEGNADEVLARAEDRRKETRKDRAERWLRDYLAGGRQAESTKLFEDAKAAGVNRNALFEAKDHVGAKAVKKGGAWQWFIPGTEPRDPRLAF